MKSNESQPGTHVKSTLHRAKKQVQALLSKYEFRLVMSTILRLVSSMSFIICELEFIISVADIS